MTSALCSVHVAFVLLSLFHLKSELESKRDLLSIYQSNFTENLSLEKCRSTVLDRRPV